MHKQIASFVVINREGWILTAYHTLKTLTAIREIQLKTQSYFESLASMRADAALNPKEAKAKIRALGLPPAPKDVQHCAVWWGSNEAKLVDAGGIEDIDLGIGRLEPFDPASVAVYPVIKNTSKYYSRASAFVSSGILFTTYLSRGTAPPTASLRLAVLPSPCFPLKGF